MQANTGKAQFAPPTTSDGKRTEYRQRTPVQNGHFGRLHGYTFRPADPQKVWAREQVARAYLEGQRCSEL